MKSQIAILLIFMVNVLVAQSGTLDMSFNPYDDGTYGDGFAGLSSPSCILSDEDGRLIIGGGFNSYNEVPYRSVIRVLPDGALDDTFYCGSGAYAFNPGSGPPNAGNVRCLARTMDGKFYVGGYFTSFSGQQYSHLVRLEQDGAVDTTFSCTGTTNSVLSLEVDAIGRILVGGSFENICDISSPGLARLLPDGSIDPSFMVGTGFNADVRRIAVRPDGMIVVSGSFNVFNGDTVPSVIRLFEDGTRDTTFHVSIDGTFIKCIKTLPDGSILVSGYPMTIAGGSVGPMIRLNDQGVLDPEWNISTPLYSHYVRDIELLPDGRSLVSGHHQGAQYLRILEPNGVIDTTIYSSTEVGITDLVLVNDKIAGIGYMESYAGIPWRNIFMAQADGTPDLTFNKAGGASAWNTVHDCFLRPDGTILIGGRFKRYNGVLRRGVAKLTADGMLDPTFDPGEGMSSSYWSEVRAVALGANDKILVGGEFTTFDDELYESLVCLNPDGSLDTTFTNIIGEGGALPIEVNDILSMPDGTFLIGGNFNSDSSEEGCDIVKILADGSHDPAFNPGVGFTSINNNILHNNGTHVNKLLLQPDGRLIVAGHFSKYNGTPRKCIARIFANGALDGSFNPADFSADEVHAIALQSDGKILVGGHFTTWTGPQVPQLIRLFPNGALDTLFLYPPGYGVVKALHVDAFDRIYVSAGNNGCKRLYPDGAPDPSWMIGPGVVYHFTPQDDKMLICGSFNSYLDTPRHGIARLTNDFTTNALDLLRSNVTLYPNPTYASITIELTGPSSITVHDMNGKMVMQRIVSDQPYTEIDLDGYMSGIYVVKISSHGITQVARILKL